VVPGSRLGSTQGHPVLCKAAVAFKPQAGLTVVDVVVETPRSGEARIRMLCASICPTDTEALSCAASCSTARFPCVLGHEGCGIVESVGPGVTSVQPGDYVVPCYLPFCGRCSVCENGKTNICGSGKPFTDAGLMHDGSVRFRTLDGQAVYHFLGTSTFSEYTVVNEVHLSKVDKRAAPDRACLLSCSVPSGMGAVFNTAQVEEGASAAVFGITSVGLVVLDALRLSNARRIIAVDIDNAKLEVAREWGATDCVNLKCHRGEVLQVIRDMTDGGVDYSFDCIGTSEVMQLALESCHIGWGTSVLLGAGGGAGAKACIDQSQLLRGRVWTGSMLGGYKSRAEIPLLAERYIKGEIRLDKFQSRRISLTSIQQGIDTVAVGLTTEHQIVDFRCQ